MADVVLKDRYGKDVEYPGVERIKVNTVDGGMQEYVDSSTVPEPEETTVALDFSNGDMEVVPDGKKLFNRVSIPVPKDLVPENILEGMNIAGIIGNLAAGSSVKFASGTLKYTGTIQTISHNFGCIPDIIMVYDVSGTMEANTYREFIGFSAAFGEAIGTTKLSIRVATGSNSTCTYQMWATALENMTGSAVIHNVTECTFNVPYALNKDGTYIWFAIGGLT